MRSKLPICAFIAVLLSSTPACAQNYLLAPGVPMSEHKGVFVFDDSISLVGEDTPDHNTIIKAGLNLPQGRNWEVALDIKNHPCTNGSMAVHLESPNGDVAWFGADAVYKMFTAFLGSGQAQKMFFTQPWDSSWHRVVYECDGNHLWLWVDGILRGTGAPSGPPSSIKISTSAMTIDVQNVHIRSGCTSASLNQDIAFAKPTGLSGSTATISITINGPSIKELEKNTSDALAHDQIDCQYYNVDVEGGRIVSFCMAVANKSKNPVILWTTISAIDSYQSYSENLSYSISHRGIPDKGSWLDATIAGAMSQPGTFTHSYPVAQPKSPFDTAIEPRGVLHVFCVLPRPMLYGQLTFNFKGCGWDDEVMKMTPQ